MLTFEELDKWLAEEGITIESGNEDDFNGRTRIFPTSGGILASMDKQEDVTYLVVDGMENCINALTDIENGEIKNCFIEMSACSGSCISGPVLKRTHQNPLENLLEIKKGAGKTDFGVEAEKDLFKDISFEGISASVMPGEAEIKEILRKMGKTDPEKELNCGSCGYSTCREKAIAVFKGKADLTMCLPFLKDKAESFSDAIIGNTPNGIIVLDDSLNIQQINRAAKKILNLPPSTNVLNEPVVRILDPVDYVMALNEEKNVFDNKKYLAEYSKYIEETIIYNKEYKILMIFIKDISEEEKIKNSKNVQSKAAVEITDKVIEKQMRVVQEIASLLGETTAETKIALLKLKETLNDE